MGIPDWLGDMLKANIGVGIISQLVRFGLDYIKLG
jgi:hypothetical protein